MLKGFILLFYIYICCYCFFMFLLLLFLCSCCYCFCVFVIIYCFLWYVSQHFLPPAPRIKLSLCFSIQRWHNLAKSEVLNLFTITDIKWIAQWATASPFSSLLKSSPPVLLGTWMTLEKSAVWFTSRVDISEQNSWKKMLIYQVFNCSEIKFHNSNFLFLCPQGILEASGYDPVNNLPNRGLYFITFNT